MADGPSFPDAVPADPGPRAAAEAPGPGDTTDHAAGPTPPGIQDTGDRADRPTLPPGTSDSADDGAAEAPREQLSARAVAYWRVSGSLQAVPVAAVVTVLALVLPWFPEPVRVLLIAGIWIAAVVDALVLPPIRRRAWWFAIGDEEIDLHRGLLTTTRTVVPMVRVQHVDLHRTALADRFGLAEIELHTAAGSLKIPALDRDQAERIRRRVAILARVPDDV